MSPTLSPTVLIVDDDDLVRHTLRTALEHFGYRVREAADCDEAVAKYRTDGEDAAVVLLDVQLPVEDGPQTFDALRRMDQKVVVCFMSGHAGAYMPEDLIERGGRVFFQKPFPMRDLASTLHSLVGRPGDRQFGLDCPAI